jgi:catechol 2,3-dioxygenase-like lactoylglutathione lyase family enzyme
MIDHVSVPVRDLAAAMRFYDALLAPLGRTRLETRSQTAGWGKDYPEFWVNLRADANEPSSDGTHICFRARSTAVVDEFHAAALKAGGTSDGAPGLRPQHGEGYYAAFVRDLDGNRIEAVTFLKNS